jgi:hypothetical protein
MRWLWRRKPVPLLPDDGRAYFRLKHREYDELVSADPKCERKVLDPIFAKDEAALTWDDVFTLESILIEIKPLDDIRREHWWWRDRYQSLAPADEFDAYLASKPPESDDSDGGKVRSDVRQLAGSVHYILTTDTEREAILNKFRVSMLTIVLVIFLTIIIVGSTQLHDYITASLLVLFAGYAGGVVSVQQRLQSAKDGLLINRTFETTSSKLSLYVVPLQGAVFAVFLYLLFIGGLVQGDLFPKMVHDPTGDYCNLTDNVVVQLLNCTAPAGPVAFAKLLAWSFIAGFAERLVPDTITRLVSSAAKGQSK